MPSELLHHLNEALHLRPSVSSVVESRIDQHRNDERWQRAADGCGRKEHHSTGQPCEEARRRHSQERARLVVHVSDTQGRVSTQIEVRGEPAAHRDETAPSEGTPA